MPYTFRSAIGVVGLLACCVAAVVHAQSQAPTFERPVVNDDGSLQVPAFTLPFSEFASPEAKANFIQRMRHPHPMFSNAKVTIEQVRAQYDEEMAPRIAKQKARYAVEMQDQTIGGVFTQVFTPKQGIAAKNKNRVLINLHGGGFIVGGKTQSQVESIPIAAEGKIKVISIDYRMAPEHRFPAASEDVAAVYKELLKSYKPEAIGIYGCSAGGTLTAQSVAWFQKVNLPNPAGIGIFCASLYNFGTGDSAFATPRLGGILPPPGGMGGGGGAMLGSYSAGASMDDPLVTPAKSKELLKKFPPTLFISGTRASELSAMTRSHVDLVQAGVDARMFLWDALDHGFMGEAEQPESVEAYRITVNFFDEQMDKAAGKHGSKPAMSGAAVSKSKE